VKHQLQTDLNLATQQINRLLGQLRDDKTQHAGIQTAVKSLAGDEMVGGEIDDIPYEVELRHDQPTWSASAVAFEAMESRVRLKI